MRMSSLLAISLLVAPLATIASQESPALKLGDRVRVIAPSVSGGPFVGTLVTLQTDSLVVQSSANAWRLSLASVKHFDLSRGRKSNALLGAGIGLLVGAGVGALIGSGCDLETFGSKGECIALGAAVFGGPGALVGAITGALVRTERWAEVPLDHLRISFMPQRGGRVQFMASLNL